MTPLAVIREYVGDDPTPFLKGRCWEIFDLLRQHFPQARALYDERLGHVVTLIDGCIYDASGRLYCPLGNAPRPNISQLRRNAERLAGQIVEVEE